ncbi:MAG: DUF2238 domain-containing protein [Flavobacterium sp.]
MKNPFLMLSLAFAVLVWSLINPLEYFTAFLEVLPGVLGIIILVATFKKFRFSDFTYFLIMLHCIILFVGGHYTYAEVPIFDWLKDAMGFERNNYDKLGHFAQGLVPAMIIREIFLRKEVVARKSYLNLIIVLMCFGISAAYELIEWFVSVMTGDGGDAFLGTQGYVWDTQSDMLFAGIGALFGLFILKSFQDRSMAKTQ